MLNFIVLYSTYYATKAMRQKVINKLNKYKILKMRFVWIVELQGNGKYEDNPDFHINPCHGT